MSSGATVEALAAWSWVWDIRNKNYRMNGWKNPDSSSSLGLGCAGRACQGPRAGLPASRLAAEHPTSESFPCFPWAVTSPRAKLPSTNGKVSAGAEGGRGGGGGEARGISNWLIPLSWVWYSNLVLYLFLRINLNLQLVQKEAEIQSMCRNTANYFNLTHPNHLLLAVLIPVTPELLRGVCDVTQVHPQLSPLLV